MSNNMERDQVDSLTAKEREEEEEMKRELLDMKMYETWYTYKDMKEILGFINESKDMANMASDEKNTSKESKSNECAADRAMKTNLGQQVEIQEHSDTSRLIHSYRSNHMSPVLDRISTQSCSSPEPTTSVTDSRSSVYRGKNLDSDNMFDRLQDNINSKNNYPHPTNRYISLKSKNSLQELHGVHNAETKMDTHSEREQKLEPWQIDPLNSLVSENDVPLRQPDRSLVQDRMPFRLCKDAKTPEAVEKLLLSLNIHLKETAELWHSWHRSTDSKFQWGSPIQVGHVRSSLDKKLLTSTKTEQNQTKYINKYNTERPNKRKSIQAASSFSNKSYSSSDEDEKIMKKKKIQLHEETHEEFRSNKDTCAAGQSKDQNFDTDLVITYNSESENLEVYPGKQYKEPSPELLPLYPKRITPPNIRKNINKKKPNINVSTEAISVRKNKEEQSAISLLPEEDESLLTDQEILIELEKDSNKGNVKSTLENVEIKPLPVKGLSHRIRNECKNLEKIQIEKRKKVEMEKEVAQRKESEEKKKREEFYKKQIEERREKEKQKQEREKAREEKSKKWNNIVDIKSRRKNNEESKGRLQDLREESQNTVLDVTKENTLLQETSSFERRTMEIVDDDDDLIDTVECPICNKPFASDRIEAHAAGCEQYITDNEGEANDNLFKNKYTLRRMNNAQVLECGICLKYKTTNGIDYEEHVSSCLERQHQRESLNDCANVAIDSNVVTSPIRCYRPISEQTDSEIDYRRQFPSNSRSQKHSNRKRKH